MSRNLPGLAWSALVLDRIAGTLVVCLGEGVLSVSGVAVPLSDLWIAVVVEVVGVELDLLRAAGIAAACS
jgi:hypothetical protein